MAKDRSKSKKSRSRHRYESDEDSSPRSRSRRSRDSSVVVLDSDDSQHASHSSPVKSFETESVTIDSFDSYYKILLGYLMEQHWLATETAAPLLSLQHDHCRCPFLLIDDVNEAYPNRLCVDSIFDDIVLMHLSAAFYVKKKKYCTAYNLQLAIINTFLKEILQKEKDSNWYIPLLGVFCSDLILLAKKSEEQDHDLDPEPYMEDVANVIMGLYRQCVADNRTDLQASKKVSIVSLTVRLFKLYFETNKMALLKPLIRAIDYLNPCFLTLISLSDLVAYNYFLGKKAIFDGDMQTANKALEHAFLHCPDRFRLNKRNILIYWLPVKMCLGYVPSSSVLKEFDLVEFDPIVEGVNHGDIESYRKGLARHSHFFMKSGIFLILEKLISLTYLALLKQIVEILNDGSFHIKLEPFLHCLKAAGEEIADLDEAGNIVAGLIADGKVKGYISQSHQTIVLSKKDPFPLETIEDEVKDAKIVLASQSPNRLALLKELGIDPLVVVSGFEENLPKTLPPAEFVEETAKGKAVEVANVLNEKKTDYDVIIACDTVVVVDGEIIGKPEDSDDALRILQKLNNRWHSVFSGVTIINKQQQMEKFNVETQIKFGDFPIEVYKEYIKSGECMNRAGAYGIQHKASAFVESVNGCYFNIVGIPIHEVVKRVRKLILKK